MQILNLPSSRVYALAVPPIIPEIWNKTKSDRTGDSPPGVARDVTKPPPSPPPPWSDSRRRHAQ